MSKPEPVTMFLSYAHEDESLRSELEKHLSLLQRQGLVSTWQDRRIMAGTDWAEAIDEHLNSASIILLLISADFLASDYCYGVEMQRALDRDKAGQARVIPIIVRPCDKKGAPFAHLQALPKDARAITAWNNRDEAWTDVIAGIRRVIEALPPLAVSTSPAALPPIWNVPYPHNPLFTGREELLTQLVTTLHTGQPTALSQPQAISGLGGIGKTQLALEYTYRYRGDYQAVLWAQADTRENLTSSYLTIATLLNLPEKNEQESVRIIAAVKNWLQRHTNWLLILDNADDLALARDFLPPSVGGHVLLTTRAQATGPFARCLQVDLLSTELGALFLLRRANRLAPDTPLEQAEAAEQAHAKEICEALGGLPLALDQAGAYIEETRCGLSDYLPQHQARQAVLLQRRGGVVSDHPEPVATTWSLSFERVERANPAAADVLRLCAFLSADAIPEEIMVAGMNLLALSEKHHTKPEKKGWLPAFLKRTRASTSQQEKTFVLDDAIMVICAYSLLSRDPQTHTLSIHRLVQAVQRESMTAEKEKQWKQRAVQAVNASYPDAQDIKQWDACERWLPHALACATWIEQESIDVAEAVRLLNQTGYYLDDRARYVEAEPLLKRALSIREQQLGPHHPDTARSLNNLANLYHHQGKYQQAEPLYQRALAIREQQLGPQHPDTATSLNNLAMLYKTQGKYEQTEPLYQRALAIREQQVGAQHPDTATSLNNLAMLYKTQGKYEQTEPLYQRALSIREQQLGPEHPDTATSLNNLAALYWTQGKYEQAEPLFQRALTICEQQLGPEHPDTGTSLNNLAELYRAQGKYEQAEPLFQRVLSTYEQQLGPEHPWTATSLNNLANLYHHQGKYQQAEPLYQRALAIREQQLGPQHPDTALSVWWLAVFSEQQQQYEQAASFYQRALAIDEHALGPQHPTTQNLRANYARLLRTMGRDTEVAALDQP